MTGRTSENLDYGPFGSIGGGMISLVNVGLSLGNVSYDTVCDLSHTVTVVFCTAYYLM